MRLSDPAFRAIFEDSPVGICVIDRNMKVVDVNAAYAEMLGRTEAEVMAAYVPDFTYPDDRARDVEQNQRLLAGEIRHYKADKRYIRKDGETIWARIVVTAMLDPSGRSQYVFSFAQPISDERALRGLLPSCPTCSKVHAPDGRWDYLDAIVRESSNAVISRERCPDCQIKA